MFHVFERSFVILWWLSIYTVRVACFVVYGASRFELSFAQFSSIEFSFNIWLMVIFGVVDSDRLEPDVC